MEKCAKNSEDIQRYNELIGLIKFCAKRFSQMCPNRYYNYDDFLENGYTVYAICLKVWGERGLDYKNGFKKYFKTSLWNSCKDMMTKAFSKKRDSHNGIICYEDIGENELLTDGGFNEIHYKELISHVVSALETELEKKIFAILVNPPEALIEETVLENRRKMKASIILGFSLKGTNTVKLSSRNVIKYLNDNGDNVSENLYYDAFKNLKK